MAEDAPTIEDYYQEDRTFPPPASFVERAAVSDPGLYERAGADPAVRRTRRISACLRSGKSPISTSMNWSTSSTTGQAG